MAAGQQLSMRVGEQDGVCILALEGELDIATAPALREKLVDLFSGGVDTLVIDLANLAYVDSLGVGVLVGALKRFREGSGTLQLQGAQGQVNDVLDITGVGQLFERDTP